MSDFKGGQGKESIAGHFCPKIFQKTVGHLFFLETPGPFSFVVVLLRSCDENALVAKDCGHILFFLFTKNIWVFGDYSGAKISRLIFIVFRIIFCLSDNIFLKMSEYGFDEFLRVTKPIKSTANTCSFDHELRTEISCDISIIPEESEPLTKKAKLAENQLRNILPIPIKSEKPYKNTRLAGSRLTKVTLNQRKFPTFHIADNDEVYVYHRSFNTKYTIVGICSVKNCDAKCKIIPNEILLVSKDPKRRRLKLNICHESIQDLRFEHKFISEFNSY